MNPTQYKALTKAIDFFKPGTGAVVGVYLMPFNRKYELGYITTLKGTAEKIISEARQVSESCQKAIPGSLVTTHVESRESLEIICQVGISQIFDKNGEELVSIEEFLKMEVV